MDAVLFICLSIVVTAKVAFFTSETPEQVSAENMVENRVDQTKRVAKINEAYYEDPNAFSEIINALGFPKA